MAQFLKRGSLGRLGPADGGASDPELCEVRLTPEEYDHIWRLVRKAEKEASKAREEAEAVKEKAARDIALEVSAANHQLTMYKNKIDQEATRRIAEAEEAAQEAFLRAEQAEQALEKQMNLNHNLKRIARERANSDRGITPKKEHDGYLVLSSRQWKEKYMYDLTEEEYKALPDDFRRKHGYPCSEQRTADTWKSIIQTPYDASIPINQIGPIIEEDDLWNGGVLDDIGCSKKLRTEFNGTYHEFGEDENGYRINGLYRWVYHANYKSGFWELEIYTTKSLRVPPHRRPVVKSKKRKNGEEKREIAEVFYEFQDDSNEYL